MWRSVKETREVAETGARAGASGFRFLHIARDTSHSLSMEPKVDDSCPLSLPFSLKTLTFFIIISLVFLYSDREAEQNNSCGL